MSHFTTGRFVTATRYALLEQAHNRLAFGLLFVFVPIWYYLVEVFTTPGEAVDFKFRVTHTILHADAHNLTLINLGLNALTMIVGFMLYASTRRGTAFDRRLALCGFPRTTLLLAKLTTLAVVALVVSLYTTAMLMLFWHPGRPTALPEIWTGFFCAALTYGALGLLLGVLVKSELAGFFGVIMLSLIDTFIQNPLGNPAADKDIVTYFPSFAPTQIAVAGGFTHAAPGAYLLIALAWPVAFALLGLAIFWLRTRASSLRREPLPCTTDILAGSAATR